MLTANQPPIQSDSTSSFVTPYPQDGGWLLVEGPAPGSAKFVCKWLKAARYADRLLEYALRADPEFKSEIGRLIFLQEISIACTAMDLLKEWFANDGVFLIHEQSEIGELFPALVQCGFLELHDGRYLMTVPVLVEPIGLRASLKAIAATEDEFCQLHPGRLLTTTSLAVVAAERECLLDLHWVDRWADRKAAVKKARSDAVSRCSSADDANDPQIL